MKNIILILAVFLLSCGGVTEQERKELEQTAKMTFPDKKIIGTRITRRKDSYTVFVDMEGEKPVYLRCRRFTNDNGDYWNCQKP